jgi:(2Fe-2S) ferredoxin
MKSRAKELAIPNIRVNMAGCLERCEFGPAMVIYPEGVWYRPQSRADIDEILDVHVQKGGRVERLMLTEKDRV